MGRQHEVEQEPGDDDFCAVSAVHAGLRSAELEDTSAQPAEVPVRQTTVYLRVALTRLCRVC